MPKTTPHGWIAPVSSESLQDCRDLADALRRAAASPNGHVPCQLAQLALSLRADADGRHELLAGLSPAQRRRMTRQLALLASAAASHRWPV